MIVDAHTHIFPAEFHERRAELCRRDALFAEMYGDRRSRMATAAELITSMDASGVRAAVAAGFAWEDAGLCRAHNDALIAAARASAGRLLPFVAVSLGDPEAAAAEVARCRLLGARGVGELRPERAGLTLAGGDDADTLARIAGDLPLLIHASEPVGHGYPGKDGQSIAGLYRFIERHPRTTVIAAHMGGGLPFYAHMPEVRRLLANTYVDTAAWPLLYSPAALRAVADLIGADRILFATDFPLRAHATDIELLRTAPLTPDERRMVLGGNATALFGLEE